MISQGLVSWPVRWHWPSLRVAAVRYALNREIHSGQADRGTQVSTKQTRGMVSRRIPCSPAGMRLPAGSRICGFKVRPNQNTYETLVLDLW
jgi:hypothetical protein